MKGTILVKVCFKPKNSIFKLKSIRSRNFLNINTKKAYHGFSLRMYRMDKCDIFSKIDDDYLLVKDDFIYIDFISDVSENDELVLDDILDADLGRQTLNEIWDSIEDDFSKEIELRNKPFFSRKYLFNYMTYSSSTGYDDYDSYSVLESIYKFEDCNAIKLYEAKKDSMYKCIY